MSNYQQHDFDELAGLCRVLGNRTRLEMLSGLVACCGESEFEVDADCCGSDVAGMNVGDLQKSADLAASTVSHHVRELRSAGLISVERRGRQIFCRANLDRIRDLANMLQGLVGRDQEPVQTAGCCVIVKPVEQAEVKR